MNPMHLSGRVARVLVFAAAVMHCVACEPHFLDDSAPLPVWADTASMTGRAVAVSLQASRTGLLAHSLLAITDGTSAAAYRAAHGSPDDCPAAEATTAGSVLNYGAGCVAGHETVRGTIVLARTNPEETLVIASDFRTRWMALNGRMIVRHKRSSTGAIHLEIDYTLLADVIQGERTARGESLEGQLLWSTGPGSNLDAVAPIGGGYELRYTGLDDRGGTRVLSLVPQNIGVASECRYPESGSLLLAQGDLLFGILRFGEGTCIGGDATMISLDSRAQPVDLNLWRGGCTAPEVCDEQVQRCLASCDVGTSDCAQVCSRSYCIGPDEGGGGAPDSDDQASGSGEVKSPHLNCDDRWELCVADRCPPAGDPRTTCIGKCDDALLRCAAEEATAPTDPGVDTCRVNF